MGENNGRIRIGDEAWRALLLAGGDAGPGTQKLARGRAAESVTLVEEGAVISGLPHGDALWRVGPHTLVVGHQMLVHSAWEAAPSDGGTDNEEAGDR